MLKHGSVFCCELYLTILNDLLNFTPKHAYWYNCLSFNACYVQYVVIKYWLMRFANRCLLFNEYFTQCPKLLRIRI